MTAVGSPLPCEVTAPLPWSESAADPWADMRAMAARLATVPFRRDPLIVSPHYYDLYQRELARIDAQNRVDCFRREMAWRRLRAKRLTLMYAAYRRRARRRNR